MPELMKIYKKDGTKAFLEVPKIPRRYRYKNRITRNAVRNLENRLRAQYKYFGWDNFMAYQYAMAGKWKYQKNSKRLSTTHTNN